MAEAAEDGYTNLRKLSIINSRNGIVGPTITNKKVNTIDKA